MTCGVPPWTVSPTGHSWLDCGCFSLLDRYLIGVQAVPGMPAIAAATDGFAGAVTEKQAPARRAAPVNAAE